MTDAHLHLYDLLGHQPSAPDTLAASHNRVLSSCHSQAEWQTHQHWLRMNPDLATRLAISFGIHPQHPVRDEQDFMEGLVAAHLANGVSLTELGTPIHDPVRLRIPRPQPIANGWRGEVVTIDHFGNLGTNLPGEAVQALPEPVIRVAGREIRGLSKTFGDRPPGELVALVDSDGKLAVSIVNGSAQRELSARIGDSVEVVEGI